MKAMKVHESNESSWKQQQRYQKF